MNKKILLLVILAFLFLSRIAHAHTGIPFPAIAIPFFPLIVLVESVVFLLLAKKQSRVLRETQPQRIRIRFLRILGVVFIANMVSFVLGSLFLGPVSAGLLSYVIFDFDPDLDYLWASLSLVGCTYIASVFVEWGMYVPYLRKFIKISNLLIISLIANVATYAFFGYFVVWQGPTGGPGCIAAEAVNNLGAIRAAQETYYAENGAYCECKPSPPGVEIGRRRHTWVDAGGFTRVGFVPDGLVVYQYAVKVSDDGQSYIATAVGDIDGDGIRVTYTVTNNNPKAVKEPPDEY